MQRRNLPTLRSPLAPNLRAITKAHVRSVRYAFAIPRILGARRLLADFTNDLWDKKQPVGGYTSLPRPPNLGCFGGFSLTLRTISSTKTTCGWEDLVGARFRHAPCARSAHVDDGKLACVKASRVAVLLLASACFCVPLLLCLRLHVVRLPRGRVFALKREWSSWKPDPAILPRTRTFLGREPCRGHESCRGVNLPGPRTPLLCKPSCGAPRVKNPMHSRKRRLPGRFVILLETSLGGCPEIIQAFFCAQGVAHYSLSSSKNNS